MALTVTGPARPVRQEHNTREKQSPQHPHYFIPEPFDNARLANLCGPLDENLRQISAALDVTLFRRGEKFIASGNNGERAVQLLEQFYLQAVKPITVDEIQLAIVEQRAVRATRPADSETAAIPEADRLAAAEAEVASSPHLKTRAVTCVAAPRIRYSI